MPVPIMVLYPRDPFLGLGRFLWQVHLLMVLLGQFFDKFLLESLILAQDERWRRA